MKVSLKDFVQNGSLGLVELGISRSAIERYLGSPDMWGPEAGDYRAAIIWKYGDIEFHFQNNTLWMIFMDDFSVLSGGSKIELDAWFARGDLTCDKAEQLLLTAGIAYRKKAFPYNDNGVHLVTSVGTVLQFCGNDAAHVTLHAIKRQIEVKS